MGSVEKNLVGRGDSRSKGLKYDEGVYRCDPVAGDRLQGSPGSAVNLGQNQRMGSLPSEQEGGRKARR